MLFYYHSQFQIEFLHRDGKQHTELNDAQIRSENKLHFQFNASFTSINIDEGTHWLSITKEKRGAFFQCHTLNNEPQYINNESII